MGPTYLTNRHPDFYPVMGPFLSRREIVRELGGPVWDDANAQWFVFPGKAFCALVQAPGKAYLRSAYVLPEFRSQGLYSALFAARMASINKPAKATAVIRPSVLDMYLRNGFRETRCTLRFHFVEAQL